jgi:cytoskeletal protein RodZ
VGAFGEKLRKQRELRKIELDAISNTTKIGTRMLRALEEERFDQLPGGVFNKGFVRAYARHVGLDEEEAVSDYLAALRESQVQAGPIMPNLRGNSGNPPEVPVEKIRHEVSRRASSPPSPSGAAQALAEAPAERFTKKYPAGIVAEASEESSRQPPWVKLAAVLLIVLLTLAFWAFRHRRKVAAAAQPSNFSQNVSQLEPQKADDTRSSPPLGVNASKPAASAPAGSTSAPASISSAALPPSPEPSAAAKEPANPPSKEIPSADAPRKRVSVAASEPALHLQIRAAETSWVSISADGSALAHETLIAPASTSVRASHEIVVKVGNAAGVSFLLNGREIPAQGSEGEVKTFTFDAGGLRAPPP